MLDGSITWAFTGVYGPQARDEKLRMLEELGRVRDGWPGPWCVGGDFNEILYPYERGRVQKFHQSTGSDGSPSEGG